MKNKELNREALEMEELEQVNGGSLIVLGIVALITTAAAVGAGVVVCINHNKD